MSILHRSCCRRFLQARIDCVWTHDSSDLPYYSTIPRLTKNRGPPDIFVTLLTLIEPKYICLCEYLFYGYTDRTYLLPELWRGYHDSSSRPALAASTNFSFPRNFCSCSQSTSVENFLRAKRPLSPLSTDLEATSTGLHASTNPRTARNPALMISSTQYWFNAFHSSLHEYKHLCRYIFSDHYHH